ncbi:MAG: GIY-YIG nuclease family protein [Desulfonatronospira sp. MSAO_Bac3]|nr:MAG: GIY-YIG nuclease family protein [Desulfonatronospira sp. MSAO_Bac3]
MIQVRPGEPIFKASGAIQGPFFIPMPYFVYILQSSSTGRYYCGQTDDLTKRLAQHNDPSQMLTLTTKRHRGPWDLIWSQELETRQEALRLERRIKKRGIGRYLADTGKSQFQHRAD